MMRVLVSGSSGLVGSALVPALRARGHEVIRLVRRPAESTDEVAWAPERRELAEDVMPGVDAVINLSGASIGRLPWTPNRRRDILESRLSSTETLVSAIRRAGDVGPRVLLNASAVGIYGSRPGVRIDERTSPGTGFLADVVRQWEGAALAARPMARVVCVRTGIVVGDGGAIGALRALTVLGAGGPVGSGRQVWPWISLRDEVAAIMHLLTADVEGPVNLAAPVPTTEGDIGRALAKRLRRPYWLPAPAFALKAALRDAAQDLLLTDQSVEPRVLLESGFVFSETTIEDALAEIF